MEIDEFKYWVNSLSGYLSAASHLNTEMDCRHWFFAEVIGVGDIPWENVLKERFEFPELEFLYLTPGRDTTRGFAQVVSRNIFRNIFLGASLSDNNKESFIREQLKWHIEDYITMIETSTECQPESWIAKFSKDGLNSELVVFKFEKYIMFVCFSHESRGA
jgi:hypothetical protein